MKYEVIVVLGSKVLLAWQFKSIMQAVKFCKEIDMSLVNVKLYRMKDFKSFNVKDLVDLFYEER